MEKFEMWYAEHECIWLRSRTSTFLNLIGFKEKLMKYQQDTKYSQELNLNVSNPLPS